MAIKADYLGMPLSLDDLDGENLAYFKHCAEHDFHLQRCTACNLLRYPPATACPWCASPESQWVPVEGKGAVHSYTEVHHAIQPAFKGQHALSDPAGRPRHAEGPADRARGAARGRQPRHTRWQASAARVGAARRYRHARAHGLHRRGARPCSPAVGHRRERIATGETLALPAGVTTTQLSRPHSARFGSRSQKRCNRMLSWRHRGRIVPTIRGDAYV